MAKNLSVSIDERNLNDSDDTQSLQHTFSSSSHEQEQTKTSTSVGSFPQGQIRTSSEGMFAPQNYPVNDIAGDIAISSRKERHKSLVGVDGVVVQNSDGDSLDSTSRVTSGGKARKASKVNLTLDVHAIKEYSNSSFIIPNSPALSEKSISRGKVTPCASPVFSLTSWVGSASHHETKYKAVTTPSMGSSVSVSEVDTFQDSKSSSQQWPAASSFFALNPKLLLEIDESGYGGGPCSGSATAVLDFIAEVLADVVTEQLKATQIIESVLETIPLYVDVECALVFQGLCLSRLMNFLERRFLRDDEEEEKKLDKTRWSLNLDQLCWMITDRVYMGAFPKPSAVIGALEFMLSMLQLANKDGRIEEATPSGKGLLYITRGTRQLESYVYALLKNTNRMIMYCFLPSFLSTIGEDDLVEVIRSRMEAKKISYLCSPHDKSGIDICSVLQLLIAHKRIIFCPSNPDADLNCCLCLNLVTLLRDQRHMAQSLSVDIIKHLLVHRRAALEELLVSKPIQGKRLDVLHGGFDKMWTGSLSLFFEWLQNSEQTINKVLEQCAASAWVQYIAGSAKFPGVRIKGMEDRRRKEMGRKTLDTTKLDLRHWEQINERRYALGLVRDAMSTELRVIRQDKYGWVLHAESEWQSHLQQLVHERGIFPIGKPPHTQEPEWQLCPIEGPYRMRKKLERCKLKMDTSQIVLCDQVEQSGTDLSTEKFEQCMDAYETDSVFRFLSDRAKRKCFGGDECDESVFMDVDDVKDGEKPSTRIGWNDDRVSSTDETSLHSALEFGAKSSAVSVPISDSFQARSDSGSLMHSSSGMLDEMKQNETKLDKELHCNGEYLVRPYLEHLEKIRFKYNCERIVGLDKHDGIFLIGELCLYVIENFYIDKSGSICEKQFEDDLSVIDQAMGVQKDVNISTDVQSKSSSSCGVTVKSCVGGRAWAYNGGAWGKEKVTTEANLPHLWHMWKLESVHEILKRDYQLRPVAVEIFSMDGCNDLLVFHKKERDDVFRNLVAMNLPRNMLDTTISGLSKQETNEGGRFFKTMAKSFSKRWQNGEISNFQYLMHLNTLAGRGYSDLTQYPVFPWVLADYESETLDLANPSTFRKLEKSMGCQTAEGEEEFKKRYESWDDPEVPKFHYGSHYSSAGIVLFYLLRLPPFSTENQKLQGGQFDHADRLFNSVRETWSSAAGSGNTSDVKELIPEFFYMPEFLENRFNLDLGEKQSGEKVEDVVLPPWANGSAREFIRKHREALESEYVSENLHHWIDLIFGYKQRGKAAEKAVNVFYHYTYEGSVDIDAVSDPALKASILAQINHFGQTPKQLFLKPHVKRRSDKKLPSHPLRNCNNLVSREIRKTSSSITKIYSYNEKILVTGKNNLLKPRTYNKYVAWGFPDRSLRFMTYDQDRVLSTHENLHGGDQIQCAGVTRDGQTLVTGGDDGVVCVWQISEEKLHSLQRLRLQKALCAHTGRITCLYVSQSYMVIVSGSDDCTVVLWDLSGLIFVKQLPEFSTPVSTIYVNDLTGEIITACGIQLAIWSINGDCLAAVNTTQLPSDIILSVTSATFSDWLDTNWFVTGHQSGAVKVWQMEHYSVNAGGRNETPANESGVRICDKVPVYRLVLQKVLKSHKDPVTSLHIPSNLKQLFSGDSEGRLLSWTLPDENLRNSFKKG